MFNGGVSLAFGGVDEGLSLITRMGCCCLREVAIGTFCSVSLGESVDNEEEPPLFDEGGFEVTITPIVSTLLVFGSLEKRRVVFGNGSLPGRNKEEFVGFMKGFVADEEDD
jgi:hypothetical protein